MRPYTLYDLTNTYFEGIAAGVAKAKRGRSKECRSDCPLVTLAMVLDGSGFLRRSRVFAGNASEPATLKDMLTGLGAPPDATVVMDAGIATEANLTWLRAQGYHYVVVSRLRERQFDPAQATEIKSAGGVGIKIQRVLDAQGHAPLSCHSPAREQKDRAIDDTKAAGFEAALAKLQEGLSKPRGTKDVAKIMELLGRAKQRYARAALHYGVEISKDASGTLVQAITWRALHSDPLLPSKSTIGLTRSGPRGQALQVPATLSRLLHETGLQLARGFGRSSLLHGHRLL